MKTLPGFLLAFLFAGLLTSSAFCQGIVIHSITTARQTGGDNGYTMDGSWMEGSSRAKLQNPYNFGPTGTYHKNVQVWDAYAASGSLTQIAGETTSHMFFFGAFNKLESTLQPFTGTEIDSLYNWSKRGGKVVIAATSIFGSYYDPRVLNSKWGFEVVLDGTTPIIPSAIGSNSTVFNGPFGTVSWAQQGGSAQGYFLTWPGNSVVLGVNSTGAPTLVVDCNTLDLIVADVDAYTQVGAITKGILINNTQDIFWANTIAFMDQMESPPVIANNGFTLSTQTYGAYQWYLNGSPLSGATGQSLDIDSNGTYTVKVILNCGCELTSDSVVISNYQPFYHINTQQQHAHCNVCDGTASANAVDGAAPYAYLWSTGDTTAVIDQLCAGRYAVNVTDMNADTVTASVTITNAAPAAVTAQANKLVFCSGDSSQLCATTDFSNYLWNNGDTSACIRVKDSGNYYVTATDNNGCTVESNHLTISVNIPPPVSISVNGDTLSAYGAVGYRWFFNGQAMMFATTPTYVMTQPGSYTVLVTDSNGCSSTSNAVVYAGINSATADASFLTYPDPVEIGRASCR